MLILLFEIVWLLLNQTTFSLIQVSFSIHQEWIRRWPLDTKIQTCSSTLYNGHNICTSSTQLTHKDNFKSSLVTYYWIHCKLPCKPSMMAHPCNLSTLEVETGGSQVWSQTGYRARLWKRKWWNLGRWDRKDRRGEWKQKEMRGREDEKRKNKQKNKEKTFYIYFSYTHTHTHFIFYSLGDTDKNKPL